MPLRPLVPALVLFTGLALGTAGAQTCAPACFGGGGPAATDCIVGWGGVSAATTICVDGEACDGDGVADGVCTFPLTACLDVDGSCGVTSVTSAKVAPKNLAAGAALQSAIQALTPGQCTTPGFAVPVKRSNGLGKIKDGKAKLKVTVVADGKKDPDKMTLVCKPAAPSFARDIQPILTATCTSFTGCHAGQDVENSTNGTGGGLNLDPDVAYAELVNAPSATGGKLPEVKPGSIAKSFLAKKLLGIGLKPPAIDIKMPQSCGVEPTIPCLTDAELYRILAWIQAGAPA
ncbi:MAG: hypothetical protein KIT14_06060 [bacterium]|nr:hypothetical protein [bacterium]